MNKISKFLFTILASGLFALTASGQLQAGVTASALVEIENFVIRGSDGNVLNAATDFDGTLVFTRSGDEDVDLDGLTDSNSDSNSTSDINFPVICVGTCPQIAEDVFPVITGAPVANFATADQINVNAPFTNLGTTGANLGHGSYVGIDTGTTTGSANSNGSVEGNWSFRLAQPEGIAFEFDARAYVEAFVSAGEQAPGKAQASHSVNITLTEANTGQVVYSLQPAELNSLAGRNANNSPSDLQSCGTHNCSEATPITILSDTILLNNTSFYQLTIRINTNADAARVEQPNIDIEKATNGVDADDPNAGDAPQIAVDGLVTWTYVVTNIGNEPLTNVVATDDQGVVLSCPSQPAVLNPGEFFTCTASGLAEDLNSTGFTTVPGLCGSIPNTPMYENMGLVSGNGVNSGTFVEDDDPSHYCNPPEPAIKIEKATNGVDADDPNAGDAPQIAVDGLVTWTYVVTNIGNEPLNNVVATDDQGVSLSCPSQPAVLNPGEFFTCTASGLAEDLNSTGFTTVPGLCGSIPNTPMYENMGLVSGNGVNSGTFVEDDDPSHYCNPPEPAIKIEKATNGVDADDPNAGDAPQIAVDGLVTWTYVVTNIGNEPLTNVVATDDQGVVLSCPSQPAVLNPGEFFTCTASGLAEDLNSTGFTTVPGLCGSIPNTPMYENMGLVSGNGVNSGTFVEDDDPSHYCNPPEPAIKIEKATNGVDADDPNAGDAPQIAVDGLVTWTYVVTNIGNEPLNNVVATDDQGVSLSCPSQPAVLNPGEFFTCTATGNAEDLNSTVFTTVPGLCGSIPNTPMYENMGLVSGNGVNSGTFVEDDDPSHYCNPPEPAIHIEKATNGVDADNANAGDAPQVIPGGPVTWTYVVTNTGNTILNNVTVNDDQIGPISCPKMTLTPMESMNCSAMGFAEDLLDTLFTTVPGLCGGFPNTPMYENKGKATGQSTTGEFVEDEDPSHYCNPPVPAIKLEKLTNGFDADTRDESSTSMGGPTVPSINAGTTVTWTYLVTNTGNTVLDPVTVSDDNGTFGDTSDDFCTPNAECANQNLICEKTMLVPGETMTCTSQQPAHDLSVFTPVYAGQCGGEPRNLYENNAVTIGKPIGCDLEDPADCPDDVTDTDPSHYCNPGVCNLEVNKTCLVIPPPQPNVGTGSCQKPIDVLKLEYVGGTPITGVTWYAGDVSPGNLIRSTTAMEVTSLNSGVVVEFNGFEVNDSPNDVQMVTTFDGGSTVTSEFHLSCSDDDMDGPEDCGTVIGDGKNDDLPASSNIWVFGGTARLGDGAGISCPLPPAIPAFPTATACEFTPPQSAASCSDIKDITALTMVWQGADGVNIVTEGGESITGINEGDLVTFGTAGLGNDVELTLSGGASGTSKFHVSCSDDDMNGPEDCGMPQGNGKGDDSGFNNMWALEGMTGEKGVIDCAVVQGRSGAEVVYGIEVNNLNNEAVTVMITDSELGLNQTETIAANTTFQLETDPTLIVPDGTNEFVNVVNVLGQTSGGASCDASATASLTRNPPPPAPVSCSDIKDITAVSVIWNGSEAVDITTESGEMFVNVLPGNQITFQEAGTGNDVELYINGATINGTSKFHVSCSDDNMNGSEDCGSNQGDGKGTDSNFINDWLFDGMDGEQGSFACGLMNTGVVDPSSGGGSSGGNVTGAATLDLDDNKVKWKLTNNGTQDVFITRVMVTWPDQHEQLKKMKLDGDFAKDVFDSTSPTVVPDEKAFESDAKKRKLKAGDDKNLEIEFTEKYKNNVQGDYTITVEFDNGQVLTFP